MKKTIGILVAAFALVLAGCQSGPGQMDGPTAEEMKANPPTMEGTASPGGGAAAGGGAGNAANQAAGTTK